MVNQGPDTPTTERRVDPRKMCLFAAFFGLPYVGLAILFAFYAGIAKQSTTTNNNNVSYTLTCSRLAS